MLFSLPSCRSLRCSVFSHVRQSHCPLLPSILLRVTVTAAATCRYVCRSDASTVITARNRGLEDRSTCNAKAGVHALFHELRQFVAESDHRDASGVRPVAVAPPPVHYSGPSFSASRGLGFGAPTTTPETLALQRQFAEEQRLEVVLVSKSLYFPIARLRRTPFPMRVGARCRTSTVCPVSVRAGAWLRCRARCDCCTRWWRSAVPTCGPSWCSTCGWTLPSRSSR